MTSTMTESVKASTESLPQESWDVLYRNPMQSHAWLEAWWHHLGIADGSQRVMGSPAPSMGCPFYVTPTAFGNTLKFLGSGTACSDYLDLGFSAGIDSRTVAMEIAQWLESPEFIQQYGLLDCVELEGYAEAQTGTVTLKEQLANAGWKGETVELEGCWVTEFPDSWREYELQLSKSRRRKIRKAFKWIEEGRVSVNWVDQSSELKSIWPEVVRLHQDRRSMLGQDGCFANDPFQQFLLSALGGLMDQGSAFVAGLQAEGYNEGWIAVLIVLIGEDGWKVYQSGADTRAMEWEPGHSLNALVLKRAYDEGIPSVDFLRGDEPYKKGWGARRVPLYRTRLFNRHWSARLRYQALRAHRMWQAWTGAFRHNQPTGGEA